MQSSKVKVVTGKVRFSYANVFQPKAGMNGGEPKYSVSILIPKTDTRKPLRENRYEKTAMRTATRKPLQETATRNPQQETAEKKH